MRGKNGANADAFASILTMQWRKNTHPKRVCILTQLLKEENKTMKTKKLLSLLLCFVMLFGTITLPANAEDATTTVYVTLSRYGEILSDADGEFLACVPVALCEENPDLDTVLRQFHATYHENGEDAYSSYEGEYGTAINMLWEDESQLFGYQVNGGTESVYGLSHTVKHGDYVDVCIYENKYPETESYTKFDTYHLKSKVGEDVTLSLSIAGYDENWNTVFSPCPDTEITINGEPSGYTTDENGDVTFTLDTEGKYIVSAKKEKIISDSTVAAICAPVCVVDVKEDKTEEVLFNIASKYSSDEAMSDGTPIGLRQILQTTKKHILKQTLVFRKKQNSLLQTI